MTDQEHPHQKPIMAAIIRLAAERRIDLTSLATEAGLSPNTLTKARKRGSGLSERSVQMLLDYLKVSPNELIPAAAPPAHIPRGEVRRAPARKIPTAPMTKDLPIMGTAAGAAINNGFEITTHVTEYVSRAPGLVGVPDAYAIFVVGESMMPQHHPRDLCLIHPYRPYKRGDSVIIQVRAQPGGPLQGYIKVFKSETADHLVVEQHNPKAELKFLKNTVVSVHKVMTMNELFTG
jgi:phage repressor protein C with HTH and peptisase S24 domain